MICVLINKDLLLWPARRLGLLAIKALMGPCRMCSADAQTDEDFPPETWSRLCSKNTLVPCITSDCSSERSISGVVVALSSWVAAVKWSSFILFIYLFITVLVFRVMSLQFWYNHYERFTVGSQCFPGQTTWRRALAELHYLTSCKPTRALHRADSTVNKPAPMLVFFDLCCD